MPEGRGGFNEARYKALLEGLEAVEVNFSSTFRNKDFRTDSDFWTKEPRKNPKLKYDKIGNLIKSSQYGISVSMNEDAEGYPIYRMNEIHNMMCDLNVDKHADISPEEFSKFKLNDRDVLFNRTNSYEWVGRTGLYRKVGAQDFTFASYLVRFIPDEQVVNPEYLTTYLNTKYGIWDVKRRSRQSINQTNVNPEEVKEIQIPILSKDIQNQIKTNFEKANSYRIKSIDLYSSAETLLLETLGLSNFEPSAEPVNVKGFKESFLSTGRLDAEYYQKKYDELDAKIKATNNWNTLENILTYNSRGKQPNYVENGYPVINSKHVRANKIIVDDLRQATKENNTVLIVKGDVLINGTGVGTIGRAATYLHDEPAIPDNHVTILRTNKISSLYLSVFLNSLAGQYQVEKYFKGSSGQIELYPDDINKFLIWIAPDEIQKEIEQTIKEAFLLEKQSERLLETAKRAVEIAIEQDEAAALRYIEEQKTDAEGIACL